MAYRYLRNYLRKYVREASGSVVVPAWQAVGTVQRGTGALTPTWPTHQAGDIGILSITNTHTATMGAATALTTPSGFTLIGTRETTSIGGLVTRITTYWCRASSGAQAAPVTAVAGSWSNAVITTVRNGLAAGDPVDDFDSAVQTGADGAVLTVESTTTGANRCVLTLIGGIGSGDLTALAASNALPDFTERLDDQGISGTERTHAGVYSGTKSTAGGTGAVTGTYAATYVIWAAMTVAIKGV